MINIHDDFGEFEQEARSMGIESDLRALLNLDFLYFFQEESYVIVNLRDYGTEPNNVLILSAEKNILYSQKKIEEKDFKLFSKTMKRPYGESTAVSIIILKRVLENYSERFEQINAQIDACEEKSVSLEEVERIARNLRKLTDRVEDYLDIMLKLEDRKVREVETAYVKYDFHVLLGTARHLLDRCKSHVAQIVGLRSSYESNAMLQLNRRIEHLTLVVLRLTAITIILMLPNILSSHFGMNFIEQMFELKWPGFYLAVTLTEAALMIGAFVYFKKKGWL
ncbi:magnesium transporter CorA family protein [Candidatus Micrarchaeota archaeon]|nr:magnesium transporter CorA family protein [Candidatus Micrarchaeota archaeon]